MEALAWPLVALVVAVLLFVWAWTWLQFAMRDAETERKSAADAQQPQHQRADVLEQRCAALEQQVETLARRAALEQVR